jgi:hypothetical protein
MKNRFILFGILAFFELSSYIVLSECPSNELYYVIAGAFSFLIIPTIAIINCDQLVLDMLFLAICGLVTQFLGLIIYYCGFPVLIYNYAIEAFLMLQILRLFIVRQKDGISQHNSFIYLLCRPHMQRNNDIC